MSGSISPQNALTIFYIFGAAVLIVLLSIVIANKKR